MKRLTIALAMTVMFLAETHTSPNAVSVSDVSFSAVRRYHNY